MFAHSGHVPLEENEHVSCLLRGIAGQADTSSNTWQSTDHVQGNALEPTGAGEINRILVQPSKCFAVLKLRSLKAS